MLRKLAAVVSRHSAQPRRKVLSCVSRSWLLGQLFGSRLDLEAGSETEAQVADAGMKLPSQSMCLFDASCDPLVGQGFSPASLERVGETARRTTLR